VGSIAAVARYSAERGVLPTVLWLDAHADFNIAESSPTGNLHGMVVSILTGDGPSALARLGAAVPIVPVERIVQVGVRSVDELEKKRVVERGLLVWDMRRIDELTMRVVVERALDHLAMRGGHLHVSFDVDFLDPGIAPGVGTTIPGGPNYREAQLCMEMIADSGRLGSLDIMELNPALDVRNQTAALAVDLVESLFGKSTLMRD
jgi:arginase